MTAPVPSVSRGTTASLFGGPVLLVALGFAAMGWAWHDVAYTAVVERELVAVVGAIAGLALEVCGLVLLATQARRLSQARRRALLDALIDVVADRAPTAGR